MPAHNKFTIQLFTCQLNCLNSYVSLKFLAPRLCSDTFFSLLIPFLGLGRGRYPEVLGNGKMKRGSLTQLGFDPNIPAMV